MSSDRVYAYVNHGRWVADCVRPYCGNAMALEAGQSAFRCGGSGGCGLDAEVVWPRETQAIVEALKARPVPATRNWFPKGHPMAVRGNLPHGQSARDLVEETAAYTGGRS